MNIEESAHTFDLDADFVETLQRCVIVSLLDSVCSHDIIQGWPGWLQVANLTDIVFGSSTEDALKQLGPLDSEICTIHDDEEWETMGGACAYIHAWLIAIERLLERFKWIRQQQAVTRQPLLVDGEAQERALCKAHNLLMHSWPPSLFTAAFWRSFDDNHRHFWEVWWGIALGNLGVQSTPPSELVITDSRRRLNLLRDAAVTLFAERQDTCLEEMDIWLSEHDPHADWTIAKTEFMYAAQFLGLQDYVKTELVRYALEKELHVGMTNPVQAQAPSEGYPWQS